jgi:hypothetical protein
MDRLEVRALRSLEPAQALRAEVLALNLASRRPTPFDTLEHLERLWAHDESAPPGREPLLLLAYDGPRLAGLLPLRRRLERVLGRDTVKVEFLATHDVDRPQVIAAAADEAACARAFYRHLLEVETEWDCLELIQQEPGSALLEVPPGLDDRRIYRRLFPGIPNGTIPLNAGSLGEHTQRFSANLRDNLRKKARRLFAAGKLELVSTEDPRAVAELFELYLALEQRSWKVRGGAAVARHPERLAYYRALLQPGQPTRPRLDLVLLDGQVIAGLISVLFLDGVHALEIVHDEARQELSPGNLLYLHLLGLGYERKLTHCNLLGHYGYYKARLGATVQTTQNVQLYRIGRRPFYRAIFGELRRKVLPLPPGQDELEFNPDRRAAGDVRAPPRAPVTSQAVLNRLARIGARVERLGPEDLRARLPFLPAAAAA